MMSKVAKEAFNKLRPEHGVISANHIVKHNIKENFLKIIYQMMSEMNYLSDDEMLDFEWLIENWNKLD